MAEHLQQNASKCTLSHIWNGWIKLIYMQYAHHQNELNEGIKMMCFICRFTVYF